MESANSPNDGPRGNHLQEKDAAAEGAVSPTNVLNDALPVPVSDSQDDAAVKPGLYEHLPSSQAAILKRQVECSDGKYSILHIYKYATSLDLLIVFIAIIASCAAGAAMPAMTIIFGGLQGTFQDYLVRQNITKQEFQAEITTFVLYFVYLGVGTFFATYISTVGFIYTGEHITTTLRQQYLESCLRQNIAFFDDFNAGEVASKMSSDVNKIQDGISEKVGLLITSLATLVTGFLIGFIILWKLALIMSSVFVALLLNTALWSSLIRRYTASVTEASTKNSTLAQEVFSAIRVAVAFGSQQRLTGRYDGFLKTSQHYSFRIRGTVGLMLAVYMGIMPLTYGLGFWKGSVFLLRNETSLENVLTTILAVIIGSFNVGNVGPNVQALTDALTAASQLLVVIDRQSPIDATNGDIGEILHDLGGNIRLEGVKHIYPSRPQSTILDDMTIDIKAGETTALIGASGSGKSTIIGLIERFYEPVCGSIYLDGRNINTLNVGWLRRQIGVVGQEPVLFSGSIFDNIRHGLIGSEHEHSDDEAQKHLVIYAAKISKAHEFIVQLAGGYATDVGQGGLLLSGGQKQRIAIARAIVSDPKILLLDEATSALDTQSGTLVQSALDQASCGRTTVLIAHRLSTVRNADKIILMSEGKVVEQGNHDQLLENRGTYYDLVTSQQTRSLEHVENKFVTEESQNDSTLGKEHRTVSAPSEQVSEHDSSPSSVAEVSTVTTADLHATMYQDCRNSSWLPIKFVFGFSQPEAYLIGIALLFCVVGGLGSPVQAVFFAKQLMLLSTTGSGQSDDGQIRRESGFWSLMFLMLGIVCFIAYAIQSVIFAYTAEALIRRVKRETMGRILHQDISFFDQSINSPGALTMLLSLETTQLTSMSGANLGHLVTSLTIIVGGVSLSLAIGWKLALVCLSVVPLIICCSIVRFFILRRYEGRASRVYMESAGYAAESIAAIRTIASLSMERHVADRYGNIVEQQRRFSLISVAKSGTIYAASQSVIFLCLGLSFWYGSTLMADMEYDIFQFFVCLMSVVFGAQSAGMMVTFIPDIVKARQSAIRLMSLFDNESATGGRIPWVNEDFSSGQSLKLTTGKLEFRNVKFQYPSRPEKSILCDLNLTVFPGQHVAIVGASGSGKSTITSLIERFYDPCGGQILLDDTDIAQIPVDHYRSQIALVSQEPALFQGTIRENIGLGSRDTEPTNDAINAACREASIHDFIASLPDGLDTDIGSSGMLISGGQKQRIALARALIRQPQILLLDEATSALDSESEQVVRDSLSQVVKDKTAITIAHRLTSVVDADQIFVLDNGRIAEMGTHQQLMSLGGRYAELFRL